MAFEVDYPDIISKQKFERFVSQLKETDKDINSRKAKIEGYLGDKGWKYTYMPTKQPGVVAETVKALPQAWKAGSLGAGRAMVKAYQAIGDPIQIQAPMPSIAPTTIDRGLSMNDMEAPPTGPFAIMQKAEERRAMEEMAKPQARQYTQGLLDKAIAQRKKEGTSEAVERFNSTKDIVDFYDKEITGIKAKYKENDITQMVESLPLSLSGMIASRVPVVGSLAQAYVFGGSAMQNLIDKAFAEKRQLPENKGYSDDELRGRVIDQYKLYAAISGGVQAGGEIIGNKLLTKIIPQNLPIKNKVLKFITTLLTGGVSEGIIEGPVQETGTILTEKAAGLETGPVGGRIWQATKLGAMSGVLLGGFGGAVFNNETVDAVKEAAKNPTPEAKAAAEQYIIKDWSSAPEENKQAFLDQLTPEARKIFTDGLAHAEAKVGELAAANVQFKAETAEAKIETQELQAKVATNPLTGKLSRSGWQEGLKSKGIKSYAERMAANETIIYADLDNFKAGVNDPYGDTQGDKAIKFASDIVGEIAQKHGLTHSTPMGDENLLSVPAELDAKAISEEIRQKMETSPFIAPDGKEIKLTFSVGIGEKGGNEETANMAAKLAKYQGRNRVVTSEDYKALTAEQKVDMKKNAEKGRIQDIRHTIPADWWNDMQARMLEKAGVPTADWPDYISGRGGLKLAEELKASFDKTKSQAQAVAEIKKDYEEFKTAPAGEQIVETAPPAPPQAPVARETAPAVQAAEGKTGNIDFEKELEEYTGSYDDKGIYKYRESVPVVAYRIGDIPESGQSYNTAENRYEKGVSTIGVGSLPPIRSFAISALKDKGTNITYLRGDALTSLGGDDEYLITNPVKISKKEYDKSLNTREQLRSEYVLASYNWTLSGSVGSKDVNKWIAATEKTKDKLKKVSEPTPAPLQSAIGAKEPTVDDYYNAKTNEPITINVYRGEGGGDYQGELNITQQGKFGRKTLLGDGLYFTPQKGHAKRFGKVKSITVTLKNPFVIDKATPNILANLDIEQIKQQGHDGILIQSGTSGYGGESLVQGIKFAAPAAKEKISLAPAKPFALPPEVIAKAKAYDLKQKDNGTIEDVTPDGYGPAEKTGTAKVNDMLKGETLDEAMARKVGEQVDNGNVKIEETKDGWKATISTSTGPSVVRATKKQAVINLAFNKLYPGETFKPNPAKISLAPAKKVDAKDLEAFETLVEANRNASVQPGGLIRNEDGKVTGRFGASSGYTPEWRAMFGREGSVKGIGKDEVIRILNKIKANEPLTARQQTAYEQITEVLKDFEKRTPEIAIADELNPGDSFMLKGEKHFVKEITEDGQVKIQNGKTELLWPGETIEIDRGTLEKKPASYIEKTPAGDQVSFANAVQREMPKEPIGKGQPDKGTKGLPIFEDAQQRAAEAGQDKLPFYKREQELYAGIPLNPFKIAMDLDKAWRGTKPFQTIESALFVGGGKQNIPPEWWDLKAIQGIKPLAKALTPQYGISDPGKQAIDNYKAWLNENTDRIKTTVDKLKKLKPEEMKHFRKITESGEYVGKDDNLSKLAKETQDISTDLYGQAVELHLAGPSSFEGVYFPHIYKVLEGKKLNFLEKRTIAKVIKMQGQPDKLSKINEMISTGKFTDDELGTLAKDFQAITKGGKTPNIIAGRTGIKVGPQNYAKQRQLADQQVQGLLQLIDDSPAPIAKRMVELTRDIASTRFLQEIANTPSEAIDATAISIAKDIKAKMGDKYEAGLPLEEYAKTDVNIPKERQANIMTYLSTGEFPDIPEGYSMVESKKYGPLNGFAVNDNLLEQEIKPLVEATSKVDKILRKITWTYKFLKVPANLPTVARNLYTNVFSSWMLGGVDPTDFALQKRAIQSIKNKDEHYKNMLKYDLVGSQWAAQELGSLESELTGGNLVEKIISKFGNFYSKSEEIFKAITYVNGIEQGMEPRDAAYMAQYAIGNYGKIPPLIKQLRSGSAQGPLGMAGPIVQAPFLTWKYLFTGRFMTSLLRRPVSNLLIGATAYGLFKGLLEGLKEAGKSEEEANWMIKNALKYWARHGKVVTPIPGIRIDKNGEMISDYLDLTFLSPFGDFAEFGTRVEEGNVQKAAMEAIGIGGNPMLNLMNLYRTGRNEFLDRDIYDKIDNPFQVQKKLFQEAFRQVAPSMISYGVPNMINAIRGKSGGLGETRSFGRETASMVGIKTVPYQESLKQREAIRDMKALQKDFMLRRWKLSRDGASQREIDELSKDFESQAIKIKNR